MALTIEQTNQLKAQLVSIYAKKIIAGLTWADVEKGIVLLSDSDRNAIVDSLIISGKDIRPLINQKLTEMVGQAARQAVDDEINNGSFSIEFIYKVLS